jgi:hypothetical protein
MLAHGSLRCCHCSLHQPVRRGQGQLTLWLMLQMLLSNVLATMSAVWMVLLKGEEIRTSCRCVLPSAGADACSSAASLALHTAGSGQPKDAYLCVVVAHNMVRQHPSWQPPRWIAVVCCRVCR